MTTTYTRLFTQFLHIIFLQTTSHNWWTSVLIWIVRIATFSLLLRTYLFPLAVTLLSKHIRIRSASLRSVRGVYIRRGSQVLSIERISYAWRSRRLNIRVQSLRLEVEFKPTPPTSIRKHARALTLADFAPSPLAYRLWESFSFVLGLLDPYFRPLLRSIVVATLQIIIACLPVIAEVLTFELYEVTLAPTNFPGVELVIKKVDVHSALKFVKFGPSEDRVSEASTSGPSASRPLVGAAAWKKWISGGFERSLDIAWGRTEGTASIVFTTEGISASMSPWTPNLGLEKMRFLQISDQVKLTASASFDPRAGSITSNTLSIDLDLGECSVKLDGLLSLAAMFKTTRTDSPTEPLFNPLSPTSPFGGITPLSPVGNAGSSSFASSPLTADPNVFTFPPMNKMLPASPLFDALAGGMRRQRRRPIQPGRVRDTRNKPAVSILRTFNIRVSIVTLSGGLGTTGVYSMSLRGISTRVFKSHPQKNPVHRRWLGCTHHAEAHDSDTYGLELNLEQTLLTRHSEAGLGHHCQLAELQSITSHALLVQFPHPWFYDPGFLQGDFNASFLFFGLRLSGALWTSSTEDLNNLLQALQRTTSQAPSYRSHTETSRLILPRFITEIDVGTMQVQVFTQTSHDYHILDLRTDGLLITADSCIRTTNPSYQPQLKFTTSVHVRPVFIRTRIGNSSLLSSRLTGAQDPSFIEEPALVSFEAIEFLSEGTFSSAPNHDEDMFPIFDLSTLQFDAHGSSDALCIECWHPSSILVLRTLSTRLQRTQSAAQQAPSPRSLIVPSITIGFALPRIVIYITSPDLNPDDKMELSRGLAIRSGLLLQHTTSHPHTDQPSAEKWTALRRALNLSDHDIFNPKINCGTAPRQGSSRITLYDFTVRSAASTSLEPDDPRIAERDDPRFIPKEFLRIPSARIDIHAKQPILSRLGGIRPSVDISIMLPYIWGVFKASHAYDSVLALRALHLMRPVDLVKITPKATDEPAASSIFYRLEVKISTIQVIWSLPTQRVITRIDGIDVNNGTDSKMTIHWNKVAGWVRMPTHNVLGDKWEEFLILNMVNVSVGDGFGSLSVTVDGDSGRFRIPFGFIFSDLITDGSITFKAIRHLVHVSELGFLGPIPSPPAESAKHVPSVTLQFRSLSLEASDDPFESKLGVIWRSGAQAALQRMERDTAFAAKVAAIIHQDDDSPHSPTRSEGDYHFSGQHSVSIAEARQRLDSVHVLDYALRFNAMNEQIAKREQEITSKSRPPHINRYDGGIPNLVDIQPLSASPPIARALFHEIYVHVTKPSFPPEKLSDFMFEYGSGLPKDTSFSLLVPFHLDLTASSIKISLRDYPLPLLNVPYNEEGGFPGFEFTSDIVIAEEMGTTESVEWFQCPILSRNEGVYGGTPLTLLVPKTIMPVKTYARPDVRVTGSGVTSLCWCVSYGPGIQDLVRVIESLTSPPRDPSPPLGFWDKTRLVLHGSMKISFKGEVRFYIKGSRDPHCIDGSGSGFVLSWKGSPTLLVNRPNAPKEFMQMTSEYMIIAIPDLERITSNREPHQPSDHLPYRKICAKVQGGTCFGIGVVLERSCGEECQCCSGSAFHRECRNFTFIPHYDIKLTNHDVTSADGVPQDSYKGFRSDFVHLSISLTSGMKPKSRETNMGSLHLTPLMFTHFWSWWSLFDSVLSLPIRQGSLYPPRPISPKLGRHLATLKYRLIIPRLMIQHAYMDESRDTWADGVTPWIGVKGMVDCFQADLHQRDEEIKHDSKTMHHKSFNAAEVVLKGADIRTIYATFKEPLKSQVSIDTSRVKGGYRLREKILATSLDSPWYDPDDFVELDWTSKARPTLHVLPIAQCPQFTYRKRNPTSSIPNSHISSKFGKEPTHFCLLGTEPSALQTQISFTMARIEELEKQVQGKGSDRKEDYDSKTAKHMIELTKDYLSFLQHPAGDGAEATQYHIPSETVSEEDGAEFDNIYHIHWPKIFLDSTIRDIMMHYYYCSRARKGFEYHMATRALKFIRDQADAALAVDKAQVNDEVHDSSDAAQVAASALRRLLKVENTTNSPEISLAAQPASELDKVEPLRGWSTGVSLRQAHCCHLLNPQVVMRGDPESRACIIAAILAKVQSYAIMDNAHIDDPVSGKVMSRTYTSLSGLQTFAPTEDSTSVPVVPLEVLIDYRCESKDFDRIVPQTSATFHYDKFNRLRLRNKLTSTGTRVSMDRNGDNHLSDQTDLIRVHVPRFTVDANEQHFHTISQVVTKLLLYSDAAQKIRLDKLETLLFTYDFTDLVSAAKVVADLQSRLRAAIETEKNAKVSYTQDTEASKLELLKLRAHMFLLAEELGLIFDAIKMAQDRLDTTTDQKSALLLHASSADITWNMLDECQIMFAKLAVRKIHFFWLSRQDSSTVNSLEVGDLQAYDGSQNALWTEILAKYDDPPNHPLSKRDLFLVANWVVLAPVGGITIYQTFDLSLHPLRLQIDARVGRRIMEYVWPARKKRRQAGDGEEEGPMPIPILLPSPVVTKPQTPTRASLDSPRTLEESHRMDQLSPATLAPPPLRRLGASRSFTDLRTTANLFQSPMLHKTRSTDALNVGLEGPTGPENKIPKLTQQLQKKSGGAAEMKTRSSQKSFVLVRISSLHLLLSIAKEGSFECRDAKIRTRDLEYRNQTWSFEELVNQFIPSNLNWRGWIKMAFHQPLIPVFPVAKELIAKTKWVKGGLYSDESTVVAQPRTRFANDVDVANNVLNLRAQRIPVKITKSDGYADSNDGSLAAPAIPFTAEPEPIQQSISDGQPKQPNRKRMLSLFKRRNDGPRGKEDQELRVQSNENSAHIHDERSTSNSRRSNSQSRR